MAAVIKSDREKPLILCRLFYGNNQDGLFRRFAKLLYRNFVDTCLMTASLELRIQKDIYNLAGRIRVNEASRHRADICIVVAAGQ